MKFCVSPLIAGAMLFAVPMLFGQDAVSTPSMPVAGATVSVVPHYIKYSGSLPSAPGRANVVEVKFALYANQTGGEPLWSETQQVTLDATGKYSVLLGAVTPSGMPGSLFVNGQARWIGVGLASEQESARNILVATPYSFKASDADTLGGHPPSEFVLRDVIPARSRRADHANQGDLAPDRRRKGTTVSIGLDTSLLARRHSRIPSRRRTPSTAASSPTPRMVHQCDLCDNRCASRVFD